MSYLSYEEIKKAIELGKQLEKECKHEYVIETGYESAVCEICGKDLGWWCPESPNHVCEYYGVHRGWYHTNHTGIRPPEWYNEDDCIYCHQPEERK